MVRYTLSLIVKSSSQQIDYPLELSEEYEDNPEKFFTPQKRQHLRIYLQEKSSCAISEHDLNQIVKTWSEAIQEGYRQTRITLDLASPLETNVEKLQDNGNQELPPLFLPELTGIEPIFGMLPPLEDIYTP